MSNNSITFKEILESEIGNLSRVAWIIGSYVKGNLHEGSDIDLVVVTDNPRYVTEIENRIRFLGRTLRKHIDSSTFTTREVESRSRNNDYLLRSLVESRDCLFGDEDFLVSIDRNLSREPIEESVRFNILEGIKVLDIALTSYNYFTMYSRRVLRKHVSDPRELLEKVMGRDIYHFSQDELQSNDENCIGAYYFLSEALKELPVALGYLLASERIRKEGKTVSFSSLLGLNSTPEERLFNDVASYYKQHKRTRMFDQDVVERYLEDTVNVFKKYV